MPQYLRGIDLKPPRGGSELWPDPGPAGDVVRDGFWGPSESDLIIDCAVGSATASGLPVVLSAFLDAGIAPATATGLTAELAQRVEAGLGTSSATGLTAEMGASLNGQIGPATASGLGVDLTATASCEIGTATAEGLQCIISDGSAVTLDCNIGTSTASGWDASIYPDSEPAGLADDPRLISRRPNVSWSWGFRRPKEPEPQKEQEKEQEKEPEKEPVDLSWSADAPPVIDAGWAQPEPEPRPEPVPVRVSARRPRPDRRLMLACGESTALAQRATLVAVLRARQVEPPRVIQRVEPVSATISRVQRDAAEELRQVEERIAQRLRRQRAAHLAISLLLED